MYGHRCWEQALLLGFRLIIVLKGKEGTYYNFSSGISTRIGLFPDDSVLYLQVHNEGGGGSLQDDLDCIIRWCRSEK